MSASMTAPEQVDGLEKLLTLAKLTPESIIAAQTAAREQLQLTQAEQGKVAEAKAYIAKHASLAAELQGREDTLAANKLAHAEEVKKHSEHVASENTRLETFAATLTARETAAKKAEDANKRESERLAGERIDHEREHKEAMVSVQGVQAANTAATKINETEAQRLKDWEAALKEKAKKIREQAASF